MSGSSWSIPASSFNAFRITAAHGPSRSDVLPSTMEPSSESSIAAQETPRAAAASQAAAAQLQQAAQTAAATEASQETAAAKALQDSNTAQLAIAIPQ